jgi:hypothetical protein
VPRTLVARADLLVLVGRRFVHVAAVARGLRALVRLALLAINGALEALLLALTLFSHGTDSVGLTPIDRWEALAGRALHRGRLLGVDPRRYPRDFASFTRFHAQLRRLGPPLPVPAPLPLSTLDRLTTAPPAIQYP